MARANFAGDDGAVDRRIDGDQRIDDALALDPIDLFLLAPDDHAQSVARRGQRAFRRLEVGFGGGHVVARLVGLALRDRLVGDEAVIPIELALGDIEVRLRLVDRMQGRDQVGLRLHDFWAVDLEQRIAAFDLVADLGDHAGDAAGERRDYDGAGVLVECNLADRRLLQSERNGSALTTVS